MNDGLEGALAGAAVGGFTGGIGFLAEIVKAESQRSTVLGINTIAINTVGLLLAATVIGYIAKNRDLSNLYNWPAGKIRDLYHLVVGKDQYMQI